MKETQKHDFNIKTEENIIKSKNKIESRYREENVLLGVKNKFK